VCLSSSLLSFSDRGGPYILVIPFPRRCLADTERILPLSCLGLDARSTLLVEPLGKKKKQVAGANDEAQPFRVGGGTASMLAWSAAKGLGAAASYLNPRRAYQWYYGTGADTAAPASPSDVGTTAVAAAAGVRTAESGGGRPAKRAQHENRGRVHTLDELKEGKDGEQQPAPEDEGKNEYWNGNSTTFDGGDDGTGGGPSQGR
jgi:hypothetical protein